MMRFLLSILCLASLAVVADGGEVETRAGKKLQGSVAIEGTDAVVTPAQGAPVRVPLAEVKTLARDVGVSTDPAGWQSRDIGRVRIPGKSTLEPGKFTLFGSGWGAWGAKDSFHFVYRPIKGDGQIIAHLTNLPDKDTTATASAMIRATTEPDSKFVDVRLMQTGEAHMTSRPSVKELPFPGVRDPQRWLRLSRRGNTFTASASVDGETWQQLDQRVVDLPEESLWGIGAWVASNAILAEAIFDRVQIIPGPAFSTFAVDSPFPGRGVVLTDGTQIAATALSTTDAEVKLSRAAGELTIPLAEVAWLVFNPVTSKAIQHASGKPGALLPTGDVYEGEFAGIKDGKAIVNSIILGPSSFPIETGVVAIALRPVSAASSVSSIRTIDGTKWVGSKLAFEKDAITIQTKSHGVQRIASADVVAIDAP